ncbi:hypothetical protein P9112_009165 [Eukaryota sp. TZLM1-RC]
MSGLHPQNRWSTSSGIKVYNTFQSMGVSQELLRGIYAFEIRRPSAIQQRALVPILSKKHVIAQAQSGTGKTTMFSIASLQMVDRSSNEPQIMIIAPTRELSQQIHSNVTSFSEYLHVTSVCLRGGQSTREDIKKVDNGCQVVSGTPGRVLDFVKKNILRTRNIKCLILDEADEMLSAGFKEDLYDLYKYLPSNVQVVLVSATLPPEVLEITENFMTNPVKILVQRDELTLSFIRQYYVAVDKEEWKFDTLCDLYETVSIIQAVIFVNSRKKADWLSNRLKENNFTVALIRGGDMRQADRDDVMSRFRSGEVRILIATDIIARGIDVSQVSVVINFDVPSSRETYLHRIGRSGRYGRKGLAINLATNDDLGLIKDIEQFYGCSIEELPADVSSLI